MFIITRVDVSKLTTDICDVCESFNEAISCLHDILADISDQDHKVMISKSKVDIYRRNHGMIYNTKDLLYVYQIIEHK